MKPNTFRAISIPLSGCYSDEDVNWMACVGSSYLSWLATLWQTRRQPQNGRLKILIKIPIRPEMKLQQFPVLRLIKRWLNCRLCNPSIIHWPLLSEVGRISREKQNQFHLAEEFSDDNRGWVDEEAEKLMIIRDNGKIMRFLWWRKLLIRTSNELLRD